MPHSRRSLLQTACVLALGAAVALGLARFSYALLLPAMRADLGWSYLTAGLMNTVNAAGYLAGALASPWLMRCYGARAALLGGSVVAAAQLALHSLTRAEEWLYLWRFGTGVASAAVFVSGGLLAAQLATRAQGQGLSPGLVLGIFYGGTGLGIVAGALVVPPLLQGAWQPVPGWAGWQGAWCALAGLALLAGGLMAWRVPAGAAPAAPQAASPGAPAPVRFVWRQFGSGLAGYFLFGLGYIGYMTFNVTLLREQQMGTGTVVAFYAVLGLGVMASPWIWASLLQRHRGGGALATLNALLAVATLLPVLVAHPVVALASGALFGSVFLSLVASTTALVRHNLPPEGWPAGITAFTVVFALGQIAGPGMVGSLADALGGLRGGLALSAGVLLLGAMVAARQKPLQSR